VGLRGPVFCWDMNGGKVNLSWRAVAIAATVAAVASVAALVATTRSSEALETTALVLAVIAFVADLTIALASYMVATQAESRLAATNTQMQKALATVETRTAEIREHVLRQGERMLDMVGQRVMASAPPQERPAVQRTLNEMREQLREEPLLPPEGGRAGREERLFRDVSGWIDEHDWKRVGPRIAGYDLFEKDGAIYAVTAVAGGPADRAGRSIERVERQLTEDWPDHEIRPVIVVEPPSRSGWDGKQYHNTNMRVVSGDRLDDILLGPPADDERGDLLWEPLFLPEERTGIRSRRAT
jgi:hypothetical protein